MKSGCCWVCFVFFKNETANTVLLRRLNEFSSKPNPNETGCSPAEFLIQVLENVKILNDKQMQTVRFS